MAKLARDFERRLERLVEGTFSKVFRSGLHPVEVANRLVRDMEESRTGDVNGGVTISNAYYIWLSEEDRRRFAPFEEQLRRDLEELIEATATDRSWQRRGPGMVRFERAASYKKGQFELQGQIVQATPAVAQPQYQHAQYQQSPPAWAADPYAASPAPAAYQPAAAPQPVAPAAAPAWPPAPAPASAVPAAPPEHNWQQAGAFEPTAHAAPQFSARLVTIAGGPAATYQLARSETVIGRLPECDIVVDDPNVSRRHCLIRLAPEGHQVIDLGSTNGTSVNGMLVREHLLRHGDRLALGQTVLVYERA